MKLDKERLKSIILEELAALAEINPGHDEKGRWARKGSGKVYSLTANAADDVGDDSDLEAPKRGRLTPSGKVSSKYGMNTGDDEKQCGKLNIDGKKKKKTRSCKDYPKKYSQTRVSEDADPPYEVTTSASEVMTPADDAYIKAVVIKQVKAALQGLEGRARQQGRSCSWKELMGAITDIETAQKGHKEPKK